MDPQRLKDEFGDRLSFHGGIDIIKTLPRGTVADVRAEVAERIRVLGRNGGYVLASSHHIQSDTPLANVFAMYDLALRQPQRSKRNQNDRNPERHPTEWKSRRPVRDRRCGCCESFQLLCIGSNRLY